MSDELAATAPALTAQLGLRMTDPKMRLPSTILTSMHPDAAGVQARGRRDVDDDGFGFNALCEAVAVATLLRPLRSPAHPWASSFRKVSGAGHRSGICGVLLVAPLDEHHARVERQGREQEQRAPGRTRR